jgi:hypothetical protein
MARNAATALLDRGYWPAQEVDVNGTIEMYDFSRLTDEELDEVDRLLSLARFRDPVTGARANKAPL